MQAHDPSKDPEQERARYAPIREYAAIGDCHGGALVSRDGSVDWCCLGRFDADPVLGRILDAEKGGFLSIRPAGPAGEWRSERAYVGRTNILRTEFTTPTGKAAVTDFMPVGRARHASVHDYVTLRAPFWLVRMVEGVAGGVTLRVTYRPMADWGRREAPLVSSPWGVSVEDGPDLAANVPLTVHADRAWGDVSIVAGQQRHVVLAPTSLAGILVRQRVPRLFEITRQFWEEWASYCRYDGPYRDAVLRSALALKLLTYAPSGAIVAALTTSLPEEVGGERNWDYRFCWLRDAAFALYGLAVLGYSGEARSFGRFLERACQATRPRVQIMYGIDFETELIEQSLDHLEGYRGSRPVRAGNAAYIQQQLDVYGEVLDWALLYRTLGGRFDKPAKQLQRDLVDFVAAHWQFPDHGIWEMRGPTQHHVFGKIMSWVAADRAIQLIGNEPGFYDLRDVILASIRKRGKSRKGGYLVQSYGSTATDAALLLASFVGLPIDPQIFERTVEQVQETLMEGAYVRRYSTPDGIAGSEGAFLICSFWLVDALLQIGRASEARELYERLLRCCNDVGLYAEEIDPVSGEFLGNFPQAFTHLALIQSAVYLDLYRERGPECLRGTHADRARHVVEATSGWRGIYAAFKKTGQIGRIRSSRKSILPDAWCLPGA